MQTETPPAPPRLTQRLRDLWVPLVLISVGCLYAIRCCATNQDVAGHAVGADDAYITYRYARNLAAGHGLVFNPGERAEGFSSPLYVLAMTVPALAGLDAFTFSLAINYVASVATLLVLYGALSERFGTRLARAGAYLFALSPSVWLWVSSGLETPFVVFFQVCIAVLVTRVAHEETARDRRTLAVAVVAMTCLRVDGFVTAGLASTYLFLRGRQRFGVQLAALTALTVGSIVAARLSYFGEILPLTYYAKVTSTPLRRLMVGLRQLGGATARHGLLPYLLALASSAATLVKHSSSLRGLSSKLGFTTYFSVLWLGYWLYIGGDHYEDRFLIVLIPMAMPLLLELVSLAEHRVVQRAFLGLVLAVQLSPIVREARFGKSLAPKYDYRVEVGRYIKNAWPNRLLAATAAGKIPYISGLPCIDMYGLTDRHIAHVAPLRFVPGHSKEDGEYVLSRRPDLIAALFDDDDLRISDELTPERYRAAGYVIRLVVNTQPQSKAPLPDIIDVLGKPHEEISVLAHSGWHMAVLERRQTH
jgi:arabinofuranosyltransferase